MADREERGKKYQHFFKERELDVDFKDKFKPHLIRSEDELLQILKDQWASFKAGKRPIMAYDCETDGLDYVNNQIVGFSFSFDTLSGYYVPLRHETKVIDIVKEPVLDAQGQPTYSKRKDKTTGEYKQLFTERKVTSTIPSTCNMRTVRRCLAMIHDFMLKVPRVLMHNAPFDLLMLEKEGFDVSKIKTFDTMVLTYNADTNAKGAFGLKAAARRFLGREVIEFRDVAKDGFGYSDPEISYSYACMDTANTMGLYAALYSTMAKECNYILNLDNELVKAFANYYIKNTLYIDKKIMQEYKIQLEKSIKEKELSIIEALGGKYFNIRSRTHQLADKLLENNIDTGVRTATGKMSTSEEALSSLSHKFPVLKDIVDMASMEKQLNSYIAKLAECPSMESNPDIGMGRINYKLFGTATGRLASGNGAKTKADVNNYFLNLNIQNLTKPSPAVWYAEEVGTTGTDILGWQFHYVGNMGAVKTEKFMKENPDLYYVEGMSPDINVRKAITVRDKSKELMLHVDYAAEEIRLAGNILGEKNFTEPFKHGLDVHKEMAIKLFGIESYNQFKRKAAKVANFSMLYGGSWYVLQASALAQGVVLSDDDAKDLFNRWWRANNLLTSRIRFLEDTIHDNNYTVKDFFGRPRRVFSYFSSADKGMVNFGKRTLVSHKIQGTGATIMRIKLIELNKKIYSNPEHSEKVKFVSAVHDETNSIIPKAEAIYYTDRIEKIMEYNNESFEIPINCSIELGYSLGELFAFEWNEDRTKLIPDRM